MRVAHEPGYLLIVDDNKVNRILLARGLEGDGHKVETAENGKQALEKLRTDSFDLVLLDIEMPEMNGYQVLEICLQDRVDWFVEIILRAQFHTLDNAIDFIE